jgi:putative NIF3 family GTP cyclohydrolase 1 type 2
MKAQELETEINAVLLPEYANAGERQGIILGDPLRPVDRAVFCWSATAAVIERAAVLGAQAVVAHEIPYIPGRGDNLGLPEDHPELPANRRRRELYERHGVVFLEYHSPLDNWPLWGVPRALAAELGLDPARCVWPRKDLPVLDIEPQPLARFARHVRDCLHMTGVGIAGDPDRTVTRVGLVCGGFGNLWRVSEPLRVVGADVMVAGELRDYTARAALEAGMSVVQASHYATENPGVRRFAEHMTPLLAGRVAVHFVETGESVNYHGRDTV